MEIQVTENYRITTKPLNVVIEKRYEKQKEGKGTGEFGYKEDGFYPNLESACVAIINKEIIGCDVTTVEDLKSFIQKAVMDIRKATKGIKLKLEKEKEVEGEPNEQDEI
ncbi:replication initiation protein [Bacillus phage BCPST]|uniref:Phage protein n=1 Tax=Bacillus phage BCPST TaxID=2801506 RepID=A0AAE7TQB9_9CAUD|nr:replication initiation protein [Bacillus phage BCPST]QQO38667.1 hypothetical protein BCPST_049 [Bacillus phage BCPST]QSJ04258.1 hypothetical protein BCP6_053 [Bacillus phage BCP6]